MQPGIDVIADAFNVNPNPVSYFKYDCSTEEYEYSGCGAGLTIKEAQEALVARAQSSTEDPHGWLQSFARSHSKIINPFLMLDRDDIPLSEIDPYKSRFDGEFNPRLRMRFTFADTESTIPGQDPRARILLNTRNGQHARYHLEGEYVLTLDPPYFMHTIILNVTAYAGSKAIRYYNLPQVHTQPDNVKHWQSELSKKLTTLYTKRLRSEAQGQRSPLFSVSRIHRFTIFAARRAREIKMLAEHCRQALARVREIK